MILIFASLFQLFASAVVLENESMRIEFLGEERGFGVDRVVNKLADDRPFGGTTTSFVRFWMLAFENRQRGTNLVYNINNALKSSARKCTVEGGVATFRWDGFDLPGEPGAVDVAARVKLVPGSQLSEWTLQVCNRSKRWALKSTVYPALTRLVAESDPEAKILIPAKNVGGRLYTAAEWKTARTGRNFRYPGCRLPMMAFMSGDAGVYYAVHDPDCRDKMLVATPDGTAFCETVVEDSGVREKAADGPRFAVTVGVFKGDWWQAAHLYRDWALKQKWCEKGKIAYRGDFPKKAADTHVWIIGGGRTNLAERTISGMKKCWPDVGTALTWSEWSEVCGGHATNRGNPEFFPAFAGVPELARRAVEDGLLVFPYVNARIWDRTTAAFVYARKDATCDADGKINDEWYKDGWGVTNHFGVMCPTCPTWQKTVYDLAVRCLDEFGANGVYFDQVSCSPPMRCYRRAHGHPVGGGHWWVDGYRAMFEPIKKEFARRGAVIVSEEFGEMWLDLIDVYLNSTAYDSHDVPLFPAVYQGYCIHYGRPVPLDASPEESFREFARTLVWGEAFGWISPGVPVYKQYADRVELIHRMAKLRRDHAEYFVYGTLEGEVRPESSDPDVFGTLWKDASGKRDAAAIVNASAVSKSVRFRLAGSTESVTLGPRDIKVIEK